MKRILIFIFLNLFIININFAQSYACLHGEGIQYLVDLTNAAFGACNCQKTTIYLTGMPGCENHGDYVLYFEDNFDGNSLDTSKWQIQPWGQGALNGETRQEYNSLDNISVANGICTITARQETVLRRAVAQKSDNERLSDGYTNLRTYNYTSSNIWTKQEFFHGKYEIRCRLPFDKGFWPAFWMYGGQRWNEIDVFDNNKGSQRVVTSSGHDYDGNGTAEGCNDLYPPLAFPTNFDFTQWHTFTCIFDFDRITWQVDGNTVRVLNNIETQNGIVVSCGENIAQGTYFKQKCFPIENMSIILNLAIKSGTEVPDASQFPSKYDIDYVRMWKYAPPLPHCNATSYNILGNPSSSNPFILVGPQTLRASDYMTTSGFMTVKNNVLQYEPDLYWSAGNYIDINSGFDMENGASFTAEILPCSSGFTENATNYRPATSDIELKNQSAQTLQPVLNANKSNNVFAITPNPNNGKFQLATNNEQSSGQKEIFIYNSIGQLIVHQSANSSFSLPIDLSSQPKGIYFVKVQTPDKVYTEKVLVQ